MGDPDKSDWAELYKVAIEFQQASPWEWMDNEDLFAVENPHGGEVGYCSILGSGRDEFGLGIFLGDQGFKGYMELISGETEPENFSERMVPMLSMLFVDRNDLQDKDLEIIRSLGLRFRGRNSWPFFRSQRPGYAPWFLEKEEVVFLTIATHQALVIANKVRNNELDLFEKEPQSLVLARYFRNGDWLEEWRRPKISGRSSTTGSEAIEPLNEAKLHLLRSRTDKLSGSWEFDMFVMPIRVGPPSARPYFPMCFLAIERKLGLIIGSKMTEPWLTVSQKQSEVIEMLEKAQQLPNSIWVKSDKIRQVLAPITGILGIGLRVGSLSLLEETKTSLYDNLSGYGA